MAYLVVSPCALRPPRVAVLQPERFLSLWPGSDGQPARTWGAPPRGSAPTPLPSPSGLQYPPPPPPAPGRASESAFWLGALASDAVLGGSLFGGRAACKPLRRLSGRCIQ